MPDVARIADKQTQNVPYILGHSEAEMRRLMVQSAVLRPITERLLQEAGVASGMRVLDLGSGTGDVAMLAAELVGPRGQVVSIDRSADAIEVARQRATGDGHRNIEFRQADEQTFDDPDQFDVAIGRYVLIHQADPASFIRAAAAHVRPGGIVAFHELGLFGECPMVPAIPLWQQAWQWIIVALASVMRHPDAGGRMMMHYQDAGLKQPTVTCEIPVDGGPDSPLYALFALSVRSLLPQLEKIGAATAAEVDIETLEDRLRKLALVERAQVSGPLQFCGWVRRSAARPN